MTDKGVAVEHEAGARILLFRPRHKQDWLTCVSSMAISRPITRASRQRSFAPSRCCRGYAMTPTSLESAALEIGIDARDVDMHCIDIEQRVPTLAKPRKQNGGVTVFASGCVHLHNWETDERATWHPDSSRTPRNDDERRERARQIRADAKARERHQRQQWADAAEVACLTWRRAKPARADHPYLLRKKLPAFDLGEVDSINGRPGRWLIAPAYDKGMHVRNLECIDADGTKRVITGAQRKGLFGLVGKGMPRAECILIGEGWPSSLWSRIGARRGLRRPIRRRGRSRLVSITQPCDWSRNDELAKSVRGSSASPSALLVRTPAPGTHRAREACDDVIYRWQWPMAHSRLGGLRGRESALRVAGTRVANEPRHTSRVYEARGTSTTLNGGLKIQRESCCRPPNKRVGCGATPHTPS